MGLDIPYDNLDLGFGVLYMTCAGLIFVVVALTWGYVYGSLHIRFGRYDYS